MTRMNGSRIMRPYSFDFRRCLSWSAYSIGQRVANSLHQDYRIVLTGEGMKVSLQDGYNIGWKLGMVLSGRTSPSLLKTYLTERYTTASFFAPDGALKPKIATP